MQLFYSGCIILCLILLGSCKKKNKQEHSMLEIQQTPMAEIYPSYIVTKEDSLEIIHCVHQLAHAFKSNDIDMLEQLSNNKLSLSLHSETGDPIQNEPLPVKNITRTPHKYFFENKLFKAIDSGLISTNAELYKPEQNKSNHTLNREYVYSIYFHSSDIVRNHRHFFSFAFDFIYEADSFRLLTLRINDEGDAWKPYSIIDSNLFFPLSRKSQDSAKNANSLDSFTNYWYSRELDSMREFPLNTYTGDHEIYRFTWLRSFNRPVLVRIEKVGDEILVTSKMKDYTYSYQRAQLKYYKNFEINIYQWVYLLSYINACDFWNLPTNTRNLGPHVNDGAAWILEGYVEGKYQYVTRSWPRITIRETCLYMLRLSGFSFLKEEIY